MTNRYVEISCLAFSPDGVYLCASSNTETVHIFKLELQKEKYSMLMSSLTPQSTAFSFRQEEEPQGWMGYFSKALAAPASYLPSQVRISEELT